MSGLTVGSTKRVFSLNLLFIHTDKGEAEKLESQVEEARSLLSDYNSRLAHELDERKRVARMLRDFIHAQKEALTESESRLEVRVMLSGSCVLRYVFNPYLCC